MAGLNWHSVYQGNPPISNTKVASSVKPKKSRGPMNRNHVAVLDVSQHNWKALNFCCWRVFRCFVCLDLFISFRQLQSKFFATIPRVGKSMSR